MEQEHEVYGVTVMPLFRVFIQARMTSSRFPGKVLAPFHGLPLIAQVLRRVQVVVPARLITLATSDHPTDDPLAGYVAGLGVRVHRGSLTDVFSRFRTCLEDNPCRWFVRLCADSPLLDTATFRTILAYAERYDLDVVSNVQKRTFPKGHSFEMVCAETFRAIDPAKLTDDEKEHLTKFFYHHPAEYRILNIESSDPSLARQSFVIDTLEDLRRLEQMRRGDNA
jgi:spore coat polysaccharide biosynthesis protein SpsF